jgi:hypothetical protein
MDSLSPEVYAALTATGYNVSYSYPQEGVSLPCVSFYEAANREHGQAGGAEYVTECEYVIDIWSSNPETNATMALAIDTKMAALRLKRTFSHDLYEAETRIHHKTMRYRALIHISQQLIYQ